MDMALNALKQYTNNGNEEEQPKAAPTKEALVKLQTVKEKDQDSKFVDVILNHCDDMEDVNAIARDEDKIKEEHIAIVREYAFSKHSHRLCREYKRLMLRYDGVDLFKKLLKSCKIMMK